MTDTPPPPPGAEDTTDAPAPAPATEEHRFPCPACGSNMRFMPGSYRLHCDHCGHEEAIEGQGPWGNVAALREQDFHDAVAARLPEAEMEETRVLTCANCGAQVEFAPGIHAKECPFCASPIVTDTGAKRQIKPRAVLPFALAEDDARAAMNRWLGRLWFAPNGLQEYARKGRKMEGIYVPYWTYDAQAETDYRGQRGTVYHEARRVRVNVGGKMQWQTQQVAKVRWRPVAGHVSRFFDDVLVLASRSLPKEYTDALAPWDLAGLVPYAPEYLAGFRSEAYQVPLEEGFAEAREIMDEMIRRDIRFDIGGDRQQIDWKETTLSELTFKHVLLPVWLAAYKYRGRSYRFVVNARTGAVRGERPWSAWKLAVAGVLLALAAAAVGYVAAISR